MIATAREAMAERGHAAVATAKAMISMEGRMRALEGAVFKTFVMPATQKSAKVAEAAGRQYQEAVRAAGQKHNHGQPYMWTFGAILAAITQCSQGEEKEAMKQMLLAHKRGPSSLTRMVTHCTVRELYKGEGYKLQFSVTAEGQQLMKAIEVHLKKTGCEEKHGQAPRGPVARELIKLLRDQGQWEEIK
jgi:hypothetical protein